MIFATQTSISVIIALCTSNSTKIFTIFASILIIKITIIALFNPNYNLITTHFFTFPWFSCRIYLPSFSCTFLAFTFYAFCTFRLALIFTIMTTIILNIISIFAFLVTSNFHISTNI